jgi:hypothetical protein
LFASVLSVFFFGSTISRLWQGVASVLIGSAAFTGGARTVALGMAMHVGVAFGWSAVFIFMAIWLVMSLAVIPVLLHRPPSFTVRWWVQFVGHFPFVGIPIVWSASRPRSTS